MVVSISKLVLDRGLVDSVNKRLDSAPAFKGVNCVVPLPGNESGVWPPEERGMAGDDDD